MFTLKSAEAPREGIPWFVPDYSRAELRVSDPCWRLSDDVLGAGEEFESAMDAIMGALGDASTVFTASDVVKPLVAKYAASLKEGYPELNREAGFGAYAVGRGVRARQAYLGIPAVVTGKKQYFIPRSVGWMEGWSPEGPDVPRMTSLGLAFPDSTELKWASTERADWGWEGKESYLWNGDERRTELVLRVSAMSNFLHLLKKGAGERTAYAFGVMLARVYPDLMKCPLDDLLKTVSSLGSHVAARIPQDSLMFASVMTEGAHRSGPEGWSEYSAHCYVPVAGRSVISISLDDGDSFPAGRGSDVARAFVTKFHGIDVSVNARDWLLGNACGCLQLSARFLKAVFGVKLHPELAELEEGEAVARRRFLGARVIHGDSAKSPDRKVPIFERHKEKPVGGLPDWILALDTGAGELPLVLVKEAWGGVCVLVPATKESLALLAAVYGLKRRDALKSAGNAYAKFVDVEDSGYLERVRNLLRAQRFSLSKEGDYAVVGTNVNPYPYDWSSKFDQSTATPDGRASLVDYVNMAPGLKDSVPGPSSSMWRFMVRYSTL